MEQITSLLSICTAIILGFSGCSSQKNISEIKLNQVGYYPQQEKVAIWEGKFSGSFKVIDATTREWVMENKAGVNVVSPWNDKIRTQLDLSRITYPGEFILVVNNTEVPFRVANQALKPLAQAAFKAFYYQRTGMSIEQPYAGMWSRPAAHNDNRVLVHASAASQSRPEGTIISSPGGWYDAGDYNKYVVNSAYSIGLIQAVCQMIPDYMASLKLDIPENTNKTPDVLDEMYYNLKWLLTMQDSVDGGVYHKLTTPDFEGFIKPIDCKQTRYVVQKSVTATLDFAAVMAQSSRLFAAFQNDYPGFSERALQASRQAFVWAQANRNAFYKQNELNEKYDPDINTGAYGDIHAEDEFFWAASELYLATGENDYLQVALKYAPQAYAVPSWGNVSALGIFTWLTPGFSVSEAAAETASRLKESLLAYCDHSVKAAEHSCFHSPFGNKPEDFFWGSLSEGCANQALSLLRGYALTAKTEYLQNAMRNMDYLLGRNATGFCYVTGMGTKSPMHPHHRLSASDEVKDPLPGFLVGGPNRGKQDKAEVNYASNAPDECYSDTEPSYASNEIAINWNASLAALAASLDAILSDKLEKFIRN